MKRLNLLLFALFCGALSAVAQEVSSNDTTETKILVVEKGGKVSYAGNRLTYNEVRDILSGNSEFLKTFNNGVANIKGATVFGWIGGFCVGFGIGGIAGGALSGKGIQTYNFYVMGAGAVFLIPAFTLNAVGIKKIKKAVDLHNSAQTSKNDVTINFGLTNNGAGFIVNF
jgi:hypothetical protein